MLPNRVAQMMSSHPILVTPDLLSHPQVMGKRRARRAMTCLGEAMMVEMEGRPIYMEQTVKSQTIIVSKTPTTNPASTLVNHAAALDQATTFPEKRPAAPQPHLQAPPTAPMQSKPALVAGS